jgi:surfactin synthase thioesterase subunit
MRTLDTPATWLRRPEPRPAADLRLFCFPWSGASSSAYSTLATALPGHIEVVAIELPGRGSRDAEPPVEGLEDVARAVARSLERELRAREGRFAVFGHSYGSLLGYEVVRRLADRRWFPELLVLSGSRSPASMPPIHLHRLADADLTRELAQFGGMSGKRLADKDFLARFLPLVRADLTACERYYAPDRPSVLSPVSVWAGEDDEYATPAAAARWARCAAGEFRTRTFPGGHFFVRDTELIAAALLADLDWARAAELALQAS